MHTSYTEASEQNEALDFAVPFRNAKRQKNYLLVSIDHNSSGPEACFLHRLTRKNVQEILNHDNAQNGIPRKSSVKKRCSVGYQRTEKQNWETLKVTNKVT